MQMINKYTCSPLQLGGIIMKLRAQNTFPIIDFVKETHNHYDNYLEIKDKLMTYPQNHFAIKLSSLGLQQSEKKCVAQLESILHCAKQVDSTILVDAEQHEIQEQIDDIVDYYMESSNQDNVVLFKTYQMYKKGAHKRLMEDIERTRSFCLGIKLVRGAYLSEDRKKNVLCENEHETHMQYDSSIIDFASKHKPGDILMCATHNARSVYLAKHYIRALNLNNIEFAQLLGMKDYMTNDLQAHGYKAYKYVPYGEFYDSIPYLLRRLYENYPMVRYMI